MKPTARDDLSVYDDNVGPWWDFTDPLFLPLHDMVRARAAYLDHHGLVGPGDVVVDLGCGGGYVAELCTKRGAHVVGVDRVHGALVAARDHAASLQNPPHYVRGDVNAPPVRDACADIVILTDVLIHVWDPAVVVAAAARLLRPGGHLWISHIADTALARFVYVTLAERILRVVRPGTHHADAFLGVPAWEALARSAGLVPQDAWGMGPVAIGRTAAPIGAQPRQRLTRKTSWLRSSLDQRPRRMSLRMGRLPTLALAYQAHAQKPAASPL